MCPNNKMDRRMTPTEIKSEAPIGWKERFLRRNARKDSESQSYCHRRVRQLAEITSSPAAHDRFVLPHNRVRSHSIIRQEGTMLWFTFSKHPSGCCTERIRWGKRTGPPLWGNGGGVEKCFDFDGTVIIAV